MERSFSVSRRTVLQAGAVALGSGLISTHGLFASSGGYTKTPPLTREEIMAIETALGKKGTYQEAEATHNTPLPRNDLKVSISGETVPIPFGFGGWVAIKRTTDGKSAVLMSDAVLLEEEVNKLISSAQENGLQISAIHNHFFYEEPRIFYMHIHGMGQPVQLASRYASAISTSKLSPQNQPPAGDTSGKTGKEIFDIPGCDAIVKHRAAVNGTTIKYTVGRGDVPVIAMNAEMTPAIGLNSWASLTGSMEKAHVAGDIAMQEHEVDPVIRSLRSYSIQVVALHNHMLGDKPRMIFLHYLGTGRPRNC